MVDRKPVALIHAGSSSVQQTRPPRQRWLDLEKTLSSMAPERALPTWRSLTDIDPDHAPWWFGRGRAELDLGELVAARQSMARALAADPHYGPALRSLARLVVTNH
jgi:hypothetical protein